MFVPSTSKVFTERLEFRKQQSTRIISRILFLLGHPSMHFCKCVVIFVDCCHDLQGSTENGIFRSSSSTHSIAVFLSSSGYGTRVVPQRKEKVEKQIAFFHRMVGRIEATIKKRENDTPLTFKI